MPVDLLTTTLQSLQRVVHLLAARHGADVPSVGEGRAPVPADIRHRYAIACRLPTAGSYTFPVAIPAPATAPPTDDGPDVLGDLRALFRATQDGSQDDLERLFPAPPARMAATRALRKMVPEPRSGAEITVESSSGQPIFKPDRGTQRFLKSLTARPTAEIEQSVVGHLSEIDFRKRRIRLLHPPTGRELPCPYQPDMEPVLVGCRRDLIQVVGEVPLGPHGAPLRIRQVDSIRPVDLSPIELTTFVSGTDRVRAKRPITFQPSIHEGHMHFALPDAPFGIDLLSVTRDELETNLLEELDVIWRHFACADDANLMPDAKELKRELRSAFSVA